jgi:hypothetical protein
MYIFLLSSVSTMDYTHDAAMRNNSDELHFGMLVIMELASVFSSAAVTTDTT